MSRERLSNAKIGLFTHYFHGTYSERSQDSGGTWRSPGEPRGGSNAEELAAALNAQQFAEAAADMGAEYVVFTVCHAGFNLLFPSETMRLTGVRHKTSDTDAVQKLLDALEPRGIPLVLYMPPNDNHDILLEDLIRMGWADESGTNNDDGREAFINRLLEEIGQRYGGRIAGIWFDQFGPRDSAREAILAHNPDAAIFVNRGITGDDSKAAISDYLVSEYYGQIGSATTDAMETHHSQINLVLGGSWWACGGAATTMAANLYRFTVRVAATEGQSNCGVNWACGPYIDQTWEAGVRELMAGLGALMRHNAPAIYGTVPGKSYVTPTRSMLAPDKWGVSTEQPDGTIVYLHVLNPPEQGSELAIGRAADGKQFRQAALIDGEEVKLLPTAQGYTLLLPELRHWDPVNTVIQLFV